MGVVISSKPNIVDLSNPKSGHITVGSRRGGARRDGRVERGATGRNADGSDRPGDNRTFCLLEHRTTVLNVSSEARTK